MGGDPRHRSVYSWKYACKNGDCTAFSGARTGEWWVRGEIKPHRGRQLSRCAAVRARVQGIVGRWKEEGGGTRWPWPGAS